MSTKQHDVPEELLSGLLANYKKPEDLIGENGLLKQLTKSMGKDLVERNVMVNAIAPAMIQSELVDQMPLSQREFVLSKIPMGRPGTVDEVAAMVCWLASPECSFSTGAVFDLSGGRATY
jgi:2-dehydro-3-deoxy-L-rhamnonate dehydrogenase (NAD+)